MGVVPFFHKTPTETRPIALDFTDDLPSGVTIVSGTAAARKRVDETAAASLLSGSDLTISGAGKVATINAIGGDRGVHYEVIFSLTLSDSTTRQGFARVMVDS